MPRRSSAWALAAAVVLAGGGCGQHDPHPEAKPAPPLGLPPDAAVGVILGPDATGPQVAHVPELPATAPARGPWIGRIADAATFDSYSKELAGERFTKLVIDVKTDAVYYFDVNVYPVHADFVFAELARGPATSAARQRFAKNYDLEKPEYLLIDLVHHLGPDLWTFSFWAGDQITDEHVRRAYRRLKDTFYKADVVKFRPDSNLQESVGRGPIAVEMPVILNREIYPAATYRAFTEGTAVGTLRILPAGHAASERTFAPDEIIVTHAPLADVTPVAGLITDLFSTPLSPASLRAHARGIPDVGWTDATRQLAKLDGKVVVFAAGATTHELHEATPAELAAHAAQLAAAPRVPPPVADPSVTDLAMLDHLRVRDAGAYGTRASDLGELAFALAAGTARGFAVPRGFGVPVHWYAAHLHAAGLDGKLAAMLADPAFAAGSTDAAGRRAKLAAIRAAILAAPPPAELRTALATALGELTQHDARAGVVVRSSPTAGDPADDPDASLQPGTDAVLHAIVAAWASVWTDRAYDERARAGIAGLTVAGAALVQLGVASTSAGVLVTANPADPTDERLYAIHARGVPGSLLVSWDTHGVRVLGPGKPLMTSARALTLVAAAHAVTHVLGRSKLELGWRFAGDDLYVVQARPLTGSFADGLAIK